jgi:Fe(3+) dicitrate transport protein
MISCDLTANLSWKISFVSLENNQPVAHLSAYSPELRKEFVANYQGQIVIPKPSQNTISFVLSGESILTETVVLHSDSDTIIFVKPKVVNLQTLEVIDGNSSEIQALQLRSVEEMYVYSAKKSERIEMEKISANLSTNNSRQVYSKVAGLNIFESNGAGLNTEIGGRGLSPERSTNFNMRQNGYDISADALGYPDAYYVPPSEGVDRIEVVRGAGALQYGTQFGGMINYRMKSPKTGRPLEIESRQTIGSFGFFNTFNAIGGKYKKWEYYGFFSYKKGNGWRPNSDFSASNVYGYVKYSPTEKWSLTADFSYFTYLAHQPGGLTDAMFFEDPSQSIRKRNWFNVDWNLPSLTIDYSISPRLKLSSKTFGLIAQRNASGFLGNITRADPMGNRDLLKDQYGNIGNETKVLQRYEIKGRLNTLVAGVRFYHGNTHKQQGLTSDGYEADFAYLNPDTLEGSDFLFPSVNVAFFAENIFQVTDKWRLQPGFRFESISTKSEGYYRQRSFDLAGNVLSDTVINDQMANTRSFLLFALGTSYKPHSSIEVYGNFSQNYRAINFNDLRIINPNYVVDPNLQDETGFNVDGGVRGTVKKFLAYDVSVFYLRYNNRIGFVQRVDSINYRTYRYRTNISASTTVGLESVVEMNWFRLIPKLDKKMNLITFVNFALINGKYTDSEEAAYEGKFVELVPNFTTKVGASLDWKSFRLSFQYSYASQQFTDATNSEFDPSAVSGIIPAYGVMDFSARYRLRHFFLEMNLNNLANQYYFTRRASGYPGPGIIPAEPRALYLTLGYKW